MNAATYGLLVTTGNAPQTRAPLAIQSIKLVKFEGRNSTVTVNTLAEASKALGEMAADVAANDYNVGDGVDFYVEFNDSEFYYQGNINLLPEHIGGYDLAQHMIDWLKYIISELPASKLFTQSAELIDCIVAAKAAPVAVQVETPAPAAAPVKVQKAPKGLLFAIATAPDGSIIKRTTARAYTHAVLSPWNDGYTADNFCGSLALAQKAAKGKRQVIVPVVMSATYPAQ